MEGRARDARVIAVASEGDEQIERFADDVCWVPDTHEALSADPRGHPAPALRVPHGRRPGHGRRPAAQPRQVGHGRVATPADGDADRRRPGAAGPCPPGTTELGIDIIKVERIRGDPRKVRRRGSRTGSSRRPSSATSATGPRPWPAAGRPRRPCPRSSAWASAGIGWRDIEIERLPTGQPAVRLHGRAAARADQLGHGPHRGLDHPRIRLRGGDRLRRPDGRWPVPLPARHRGATRRSRAPDPGPDRAPARAAEAAARCARLRRAACGPGIAAGFCRVRAADA